jgi:hypothetical protein
MPDDSVVALDLDIRIGINIRARRMMLGLTQQQLAAAPSIWRTAAPTRLLWSANIDD